VSLTVQLGGFVGSTAISVALASSHTSFDLDCFRRMTYGCQAVVGVSGGDHVLCGRYTLRGQDTKPIRIGGDRINLCPEHWEALIDSVCESDDFQRRHSRLDEQERVLDEAIVRYSLMRANLEYKCRCCRHKHEGERVYFIEKDGLLKVGYSSQLDRRMVALKPDMVHAIVKGTMDDERQLHELLSDHRCGKSEWFKMAPLVVAAIDAATRNETAEAVIGELS
jgi:hypothetical protein